MKRQPRESFTPKPKFIRPKILGHPNIPKPMHGLNPRTVLGQAWWDKQRQIAYKENNYCCWACGIWKKNAKYHAWLEAHECYDINYQKGRMELKEITALCHSCHNFIHSGRMLMMVQSGKMSQKKMNNILVHGNSTIDIADSNIPYDHSEPTWLLNTLSSSSQDEIEEWGKWRLVIGGKEYKPIHNSFEAWREYYNS